MLANAPKQGGKFGGSILSIFAETQQLQKQFKFSINLD